jgi:hypothetical protein
MIPLLALRNFAYRPWRSALLFLGYGMGVTVMIVLLSIGEALITQASDERLVGGGDVTVLPEGLDVEVMKTGGLGGLFFSIGNARFVYSQILASPRLAGDVRAVAPQIEDKLVYLRTADGAERTVRASADVPSATRAVGAAPALLAGRWEDDAGDRGWARPTPAQLRHALDHFHVPSDSAGDLATWAEWHYFNVLSHDERRWAFVALIVSGDVPAGTHAASLTVTLREQGGATRRYAALVPASGVRFSTSDADVTAGAASVTVLPDGRYAVRGRATAEQGTGAVEVDLVVSPAPGAYLPSASRGTDDSFGYVVPGLRASASGRICTMGDRGTGGERDACEAYDGAQSYHDHNWGVWRDVTWEWGASRAGQYTVLYGRVHPAGTPASGPLYVYLVDSLGFLGAFRPPRINYEDGRQIEVNGRRLRVPSRATMVDVRGDDTVRIAIDVEDAIGTDFSRMLDGEARGDAARGAPPAGRPYFIQMKGRLTLAGRVRGIPVSGTGAGFFETYR